MSTPWLSNTYLVADEHALGAVLIDAGGPVEPLLEIVRAQRLRLSHVLLTHHHLDHIAELGEVTRAYPHVEVLAHPFERARIDGLTTGDLHDGQRLSVGGIELSIIHTPGHTAGMVAVLAGGTDVFTGDTLFKGSVGGVHAPGHTSYCDLKASVMERLLTLPAHTRILPGHTDASTVADELAHNPFVRIWRGLDEEGSAPCLVFGKPATLILDAVDYDHGSKAWVRWPDGSDDIVPGSQVQTA